MKRGFIHCLRVGQKLWRVVLAAAQTFGWLRHRGMSSLHVGEFSENRHGPAVNSSD